jgi:hypothetical protein
MYPEKVAGLVITGVRTHQYMGDSYPKGVITIHQERSRKTFSQCYTRVD